MSNQWVIPDVHGCFHTLKKLLEQQLHISKEDELYFLGDLIDRGKYSKQVLDLLISLESDGYAIKAIKGNHEEYFTKAYYSELSHKPRLFGKANSKDFLFWESVGGKETMESFDVKKMKDIPLHYIEWVEKLPYYYLTDNYVIVHAGLNFSKKNPFEDTDSMLINTNFIVSPNKIGNRTIIHGHRPLTLEGIETLINERDNYHYICLDNGCYYEEDEFYGKLLAFNLQSLELVAQANIDS
ncbi:MAG: metallophosphoesterase [Bacteroidales bacterium]|nr:metallophosphoesterase [Bacteroidales bacterium]